MTKIKMHYKSNALFTYTFISVFLLLFFLLTTKYTEQYGDSFRPFYNAGLVFSFLILFLGVLKLRLNKNAFYKIIIQPPIILFAVILFYFLFSAIYTNFSIGGRQVNEVLYFIYWIIVIPILPFLVGNKTISVDEIIYLTSKTILIYSVFSIVIAILLMFNVLHIQIGSVVFEQSIYLKSRLHGMLGESTGFSALIGLSTLSLYYINEYKGIFQNKAIFLMLLIAIFFSGSRNAIVSISVIYLVFIFIEGITLNKILKYFVYILLLLVIFTVILYATNFSDTIQILYFDRPDLDMTNNFSRLYRWDQIIQRYADGDLITYLFGRGAYMLRHDFMAGFNSPLEMLYDYGLFIFITYISSFLLSFYIGIKKYKATGSLIYKYGLMLTIYGFMFLMFMSYFPVSMFNFATFSYVFGILLICIPYDSVTSDACLKCSISK